MKSASGSFAAQRSVLRAAEKVCIARGRRFFASASLRRAARGAIGCGCGLFVVSNNVVPVAGPVRCWLISWRPPLHRFTRQAGGALCRPPAHTQNPHSTQRTALCGRGCVRARRLRAL